MIVELGAECADVLLEDFPMVYMDMSGFGITSFEYFDYLVE